MQGLGLRQREHREKIRGASPFIHYIALLDHRGNGLGLLSQYRVLGGAWGQGWTRNCPSTGHAKFWMACRNRGPGCVPKAGQTQVDESLAKSLEAPEAWNRRQFILTCTGNRGPQGAWPCVFVFGAPGGPPRRVQKRTFCCWDLGLQCSGPFRRLQPEQTALKKPETPNPKSNSLSLHSALPRKATAHALGQRPLCARRPKVCGL